MSEENKTSETATDTLFDSPFFYVTPEGAVILKENQWFNERTIAEADPDTVQETVKQLEEAFQQLEEKVKSTLETLEENVPASAEEADAAIQQLLSELREAEAIGDFDALLNSVRTAGEALKEKLTDPEPASGDADGEDKSERATEEEKSAPDTANQQEEPEDEKDAEPESSEMEEPEPSVLGYYEELAEKARKISDNNDWQYVSQEFDVIDMKWGEGPDPEDVDISALREEIDSLRKTFEERRKAHYEELNKQKQENLEKKKDLLKELAALIEEEKWTHTKDVSRLKGQWERVKPIPADQQEVLDNRFQSLLDTFEEHKVERMVKRKQQEEDNLTGKLVILEKMDRFTATLSESSDWEELEKEFEQLARQFRKIGKVPAEKNQEVWEKYHAAQDTFHSMRFKHDKNYRNQIEVFLTKKKKLIDEAEALVDADDLAQAARDVNKLHRRWKKVGNLPQKEENELWTRFKQATDAFNDMKSDHIDELRDQEQENLEAKLKLIEEAEALKDSEEWDSTHQKLQALMNKWKQAGPVPKRKSGKIWKKFKGAMDHFYDRRRDHFKEIKEERKDNLKEKEEVMDQLRALRDHDDPIKAVELAKPLQDEFKKAGYVPIKHKNRLWKEYREVCDVIYGRFRDAKAAVDIVGRENVDHLSSSDLSDIRKLKSEARKLSKQISGMESELIQKKESLSYFKPSGSSSPLLDEAKKNIDNLESDIAKKEARLAEVEKQIDLIGKE
ncbi:MAG: DUF349 domain-containing protein [Balneolaceae bacterium]